MEPPARSAAAGGARTRPVAPRRRHRHDMVTLHVLALAPPSIQLLRSAQTPPVPTLILHFLGVQQSWQLKLNVISTDPLLHLPEPLSVSHPEPEPWDCPYRAPVAITLAVAAKRTVLPNSFFSVFMVFVG